MIFIDEIDAIAPKRDNAGREMEKRIVAQLLTCIDDLNFMKTDNKMVCCYFSFFLPYKRFLLSAQQVGPILWMMLFAELDDSIAKSL